LQTEFIGAEDIGGEPNPEFGALDGGEHLRISLISAIENPPTLPISMSWPVMFRTAIFRRSIGSVEEMSSLQEGQYYERIRSIDAQGVSRD